MTKVITKGTVTIDREQCKGCELCVVACPVDVLTMSAEVNAKGYAYPLLAPGCIACRICHEVCPDYVFEVYRFDTPVVTDSAPGAGPADGES